MSKKNRIENARILIVDDTPQNIQILGTILQKEIYQIFIAQSGEKALLMVEKVNPDLILLDIMMPGIDGFETCIRLKDSPTTKEIPIIFLTAKVEPEDVVKGFELGAVDYITKPFNPSELVSRVRTHLELKFSREITIEESRERKELLHMLCHDLANPLHTIVSFLDILEDDFTVFSQLKKDVIDVVNNGLEIIELVKRMRSLDEKEGILELGRYSLLEAVQESLFILNPMFTEKKIDLDLDLAEELDVEAEWVSLVNSVLNNLFTNALKFSFPRNKIYVKGFREDSRVKLIIRDFGIGIPESLLNDLFDVRKATSRIGTAGELGTGFGMPLVEKFMKSYGGTIQVTSKEKKEENSDHGTTILLDFAPV